MEEAKTNFGNFKFNVIKHKSLNHREIKRISKENDLRLKQVNKLQMNQQNWNKKK